MQKKIRKNHDIYPWVDYQKNNMLNGPIMPNIPQCGKWFEFNLQSYIHLPAHQHHTCCTKLIMLTSFPLADEVVSVLFTDAEGVALAKLHPVMSKTHNVSKIFSPKTWYHFIPQLYGFECWQHLKTFQNDMAPSCWSSMIFPCPRLRTVPASADSADRQPQLQFISQRFQLPHHVCCCQ